MIKRWILLSTTFLLSTDLNAVQLRRAENTADDIRSIREFSNSLGNSEYKSLSNSNDYSAFPKFEPSTISDSEILSIIQAPANSFSGVYFAINDNQQYIGRIVISNRPISFSFNNQTVYAVECLADFKPNTLLLEREQTIECIKNNFSKSIFNKPTNFFELSLDAKSSSKQEVTAAPKHMVYFPNLHKNGLDAAAFYAKGFTIIDMKNQRGEVNLPMLWPSNNSIENYATNTPKLKELHNKLFMFTESLPKDYPLRQRHLTEYLQTKNQLKKSDSMSSLSEDTSDEECCCGDPCNLQ